MKSILLFYAAVLMISCQDAEPGDATNNTSDNRTDTVQASKSICFEKLEGANRKDSTIIRLQIDGSQVSGIYWWLPHQKDSRVGDIRGTIHENEISGKWIYMQEGMIDTIDIAFRINGNQLQQKGFIFDQITGRQSLDTAADYTITYDKVDCK